MGTGGLIISLAIAPVYTLICMAYMPIFAILIGGFVKVIKSAIAIKLKQNASLGSHTEETLSAIKLVVSFAREDLATKQYDKICDETRVLASKAAKLQSIMGGMFLLGMFAFFLYAYSMGSLLIEHQVINPVSGKPYNIFEIVAATQASIMAMMTLAGITPILPAI